MGKLINIKLLRRNIFLSFLRAHWGSVLRSGNIHCCYWMLTLVAWLLWPARNWICDELMKVLHREPMLGSAALMLCRYNTSLKSEWCKKYADSILAQSVSRTQKNQYLTGNEQLKVTFVAGCGDMRVTRIAAAAKAAGMKVQLIVRRKNILCDSMIDERYFDNIVWIDMWPQELGKTITAIEEFGSHIVHCHMWLTCNNIALWLLCSCSTPVVCDAYDMVNIQYKICEKTKHWLPTQRSLEKIWLQSADGICFRAIYKRILHSGDIQFKNGCRFLNFAEPLILDDKMIPMHDTKRMKILSMYNHPSCEQDLRRLDGSQCGLEFVVIRCWATLHSYVPPGMQTYEPLAYADYTSVINECVGYLELPSSLEAIPDRYNKDNLKYFRANRHADCLERGLVLFLPKYWEYPFMYYKGSNRAFTYSPGEICSGNFSRILAERLHAASRVPAKLTPYGEHRQGVRLKNFYRRLAAG
jgi:hypothetical protein